MAVGFNLQAQIAGPKGRRPSDVQQWPLGQTEARRAEGPSEQRAAERSAAALLRRPQKNSELRQPVPIGTPVPRPKEVNDNKNFSSQFDDRRE
ncbi:hypothetical protein SGRA_1966 [Saprospira grandis str. Lewin]|uniref:Uncharacterized protein n=1 Tax=Saprospira grandis (strain Lewin) TaxID=984262 RepID=H6L259_SAPGL|nr:hypothetical protein SGRA_1966 [Saprospira grandis str. Lewin]